MNPIVTLFVLMAFVFLVFEMLYRVFYEYYDDFHPIIPEPNNLLGEEE